MSSASSVGYLRERSSSTEKSEGDSSLEELRGTCVAEASRVEQGGRVSAEIESLEARPRERGRADVPVAPWGVFRSRMPSPVNCG